MNAISYVENATRSTDDILVCAVVKSKTDVADELQVLEMNNCLYRMLPY